MRRSSVRLIGAASVVAALVGAAAATGTLAGSKGAAAITPPPSSNCQLGNGIKHVIEITFDNTHFNRDDPNVLSDLEQMPALKDFITSNGTLLSNNYTPLIAHTADDSLTNYTGLYGDRHGQGLTNTYETYVNGAVTSAQAKSSFAYWTGTYGLDAFPNMPYSPQVPAAGSPPKTPPAPWVPFTRTGCDVGDVSTANMVLENTNPDLAEHLRAELARGGAAQRRHRLLQGPGDQRLRRRGRPLRSERLVLLDGHGQARAIRTPCPARR